MNARVFRSHWELNSGLQTVRRVEYAVALRGRHVALGGSVLHCGQSDKDLDLIFYPHDASKRNRTQLTKALISLGWKRYRTRAEMQKGWREIGSADTKTVEVWQDVIGRRVDVIIL